MKIFKYLLLIVLNKITAFEALHLRIYVPDVINQHVHTRTVLLHLHKPAPPKKHKTHKKHEIHENWSSWKTYGPDHQFKNEHGKHELSEEHEDNDRNKIPTAKELFEKKNKGKKYFPVYNYHKDSYLPQSEMDDNNLEQKHGKGLTYAVHEDVNDIPPNIESFSYNYEEGYRKGTKEEGGHIRADQMTTFNDEQLEEQGDIEEDGRKDAYKEDYEGKTDAGRYFVDDTEYENTRDKREGRGRRRLRRINRV